MSPMSRHARASKAPPPRQVHLPLAKLFALLVLVMQLGLVAHRIEHYVAPDRMECGEDLCDAFSPTPDGVALPVFVPPVFLVVFCLTFWTVREAARTSRTDTIGFRAHAPPV
jgi:hypothetical protein